MAGGHHDWSGGDTITLTLIQELLQNQVVAQVTSGTRPSTGGAPQAMQLAAETDTKKIIGHDGTQWVDAVPLGTYESYAPAYTNCSFSAVTAEWARFGPFVHVTFLGTVASVTGQPQIGLPVAPDTAWLNRRCAGFGGATGYDTSSAEEVSGIIKFEATPYVSFWKDNETASGSVTWSVTQPFTWAAGDTLQFVVMYSADPTQAPV